MEALRTVVTENDEIASIPPRIFGSFVEHLGRCVYGGIFDPDSPHADPQGFREDVLHLVRNLGVTCVRYPGGNFVSGYRWEDGTGPRESRPVRRDLAWHMTEPNLVGIDDFYRWSQRAGTEIMLAVNMGTRGLQEALDELEYVNGAAGTALADKRISNGIDEPMDIAMWCIGNEMDGPWQIGHMKPQEYATAVEKTAHALKLADSGLELVACGSSSVSMPTFGEWEREVLTQAYDNLDFVSCHDYYFKKRDEPLADYLVAPERMKGFISRVSQIAEEVRIANGGTKGIALSFDEWGVWDSTAWNEQEEAWKASRQGVHDEPWPFKPHLLEQVYTAADAVVEGELMVTLLSHCDVVKSASRAQLVNAIAPIMVDESSDTAWRQSVYYPFAYAARYAAGKAYDLSFPQATTVSAEFGEVDAVIGVITHDENSGTTSVFLVNRDVSHSHDIALDISVFGKTTVSESVTLHNEDPMATNSVEDDTVVSPQPLASQVIDGELKLTLQPISWSCVVLNGATERGSEAD